jgi:hypothetical protein
MPATTVNPNASTTHRADPSSHPIPIQSCKAKNPVNPPIIITSPCAKLIISKIP